MAVTLTVTKGPAQGKTWSFTEHDTFLFGRMPDCHATFPEDTQVSRHHFLLETCPPKASLRDLGSMNGTYVNGKKCGGRQQGETPEQGAKRQYPAVELQDQDTLRVGQNEIAVRIEKSAGAEAVAAGVAPGELSELPAKELFKLIFGAKEKTGLLEIPGYQVEAEIGRGGFGAVYRARRQKDGQPVAIKVMLSQTDASEEAVARFKREMEVNAQLRHPKIVRFVASGSHAGAFYFVMDLCDGGSLMDLFKKNGGPLPVDQVMRYGKEALEGLAHAHREGFVHRDIKPGNILLHGGSALLSDFGMSKSFQLAGLSGLSMTGNTAGTPVFMPPEQIINFKYVKPVSDVFSMGATLYFLLTGVFPFEFTSKRDPIDVILNDDVVPIGTRNPKIPKAVCAVIDKAVAKKHKQRFADAGEFLAALNKLVK